MARFETTPALDDQLCFALYGASMTVGRLYKPLLDGLGLTYPQYLVLCALWEQDTRSVGAIAGRLSLEASTVTPLVKRLAASGLVERGRNPEDERQVIVRLTADGAALEARCTCLAERLLEASGLSIEAVRRMNADVRALRDSLAAAMAAGKG